MLVDKISRYYAWQNTISSKNQTEHETRMKSAELRNKILRSEYYIIFAPLNINSNRFIAAPGIDSIKKLQLPLNADAMKYMDEYINAINDRKWRQVNIVNSDYPSVIREAEDIMALLRTEYHLE
jgi:hypothetical protein